MTQTEALIAVLIMSAVTAGIRFLPFLLTGRKRIPPLVEKLGSVLPGAMMGMLVVYCLKDLSCETPDGWVPHLVACAITVAGYVWKRSTLLSILAGTVCFMLLKQLLFAPPPLPI